MGLGDGFICVGLRYVRDSQWRNGGSHWGAPHADPNCIMVVDVHITDRSSIDLPSFTTDQVLLRYGRGWSLSQHLGCDRALVSSSTEGSRFRFGTHGEPDGRCYLAFGSCPDPGALRMEGIIFCIWLPGNIVGCRVVS